MNSEEMTTTSVLGIASTMVEMSGEVECVAHATPPARSTVVLRNDRASAPLTVLGKSHNNIATCHVWGGLHNYIVQSSSGWYI